MVDLIFFLYNNNYIVYVNQIKLNWKRKRNYYYYYNFIMSLILLLFLVRSDE